MHTHTHLTGLLVRWIGSSNLDGVPWSHEGTQGAPRRGRGPEAPRLHLLDTYHSRDFVVSPPPSALKIALGPSLGPRGAQSLPLGNLLGLSQGVYFPIHPSSRQCTDSMSPATFTFTS